MAPDPSIVKYIIAVISHYLDYKGEWDVPDHLKKALNALSGLFYVADDAFEKFYHERQLSRENARSEEDPAASLNADINLDTLGAYLRMKFKDRQAGDLQSISQAVKELKAAGCQSILEVDRDIDRATEAFSHYEADTHNSANYFVDVGALRMSLCIVSESYRKAYEEEVRSRYPAYSGPDYSVYAKWIKK